MTEDTSEDRTEQTPEAGTSPTPASPLAPPVPQAHAAPPSTPPTDPPTGSYALGALAGNPRLAPPAGYGGYGGPPTPPVLPHWGTPPPPPPAHPSHQHHPLRNGLIVGAAAVIALGAGIGLGHGVWTNTAAPVPSASGNSGSAGSGSGSSGSNGFGFQPGGNGYGGTNGNGNNNGNTNSGGPSDVSAIAAKVDPGLVDINTTLGYAQEQAAGTGIVLTPNGEILTNNHVIEGATTISVTDVGNGKTYSASVVGYNRSQDVAVLQLHGASGLQTATIGKSSTVNVGQDVVGIGNAGGTGGTPSAAGGTVTALNQSITAGDQGDATTEQLTGLIETNADIQAGDSGGPLVDTSGRVIGMDTAASAGFYFESGNNQGYAIPIDTATSIAKQIEDGNATSKIHIGATPFLGVEVQPSSSNGNGNGFGFFGGGGGGSSTSGAVIAGVITSSPAQEAGLAQGDVITSVNGHAVTSPEELTTLLEPYHPGDKVSIGWTDTSGQSHTTSVQLTSGPPQ